MNKQAILNKIEELKKLLDEEESKEWKPAVGETYYILDYKGAPILYTYTDDYKDRECMNFLNCFYDFDKAKKEANKILTRRKLEKIAERLGKPSEEDWKYIDINKYHIITYTGELKEIIDDLNKSAGVTYCLSDKFLEVAKEEIGEEALIEYCKG